MSKVENVAVDSLLAHCETMPEFETWACEAWTRGSLAVEPANDTATDHDVLLTLIAVDRRHHADESASWLEASRYLREQLTHEPLRLALLQQTQRILLSQPSVAFRSNAAYAKGGGERYGTFDGLDCAFDERLAQIHESTWPAVIRAAVMYLDICFFHPFPDGNGRLALTVADAYLRCHGFGLASFAFVEPIAAGDLTAYRQFATSFTKSIRGLTDRSTRAK